jgi:hypothetical protein
MIQGEESSRGLQRQNVDAPCLETALDSCKFTVATTPTRLDQLSGAASADWCRSIRPESTNSRFRDHGSRHWRELTLGHEQANGRKSQSGRSFQGRPNTTTRRGCPIVESPADHSQLADAIKTPARAMHGISPRAERGHFLGPKRLRGKSARVRTMQVWLRLLIVWFIALALPVQGVASATLAHCGQSHEPVHAAPGGLEHHHSAHEAGAAAHHEADLVDAADLADATISTHAQPDRLADLTKHKCSSCASCCAGSVLPSVMPRIPELASAPTIITGEVVAVDAFASDGPDRPPRTQLA